MNVLTLTVVLWLGSLVAGFIGALTGLGGGVVSVFGGAFVCKVPGQNPPGRGTSAGSIVLAGGIIYLAKRASVSTDYRIVQGEPVEFRSLDRIIANAAMGSGRGLIQLGLVFLIATPIARVMFSIVGFWREGDHAYVLITTHRAGFTRLQPAGRLSSA